MNETYDVSVHLRGCGDLIIAKTFVEDGEDFAVPIPEMVKITVYVLKPGI